MNIGNQIHQVLKQKRYSVSWFASKICCTRSHAYKILKYENIDISLLMRISKVLEYDFFEYISEHYNEPQGGAPVSQGLTQNASNHNTDIPAE